MNSRRLIPVVLALAAAGAVLLLWPGEDAGPEEQVRRTVVAMTRSAEEKQLGDVMDHVAPGFRHARGWGQDELKRFLAAQLFRGTWVRIFVTDMETELLSASEVNFKGRFLLGRSEADTVEKLAGDTSIARYQVEIRFVQNADGEWQAVSASHDQL